MHKIEIASYPKSGNTWFRSITQDFFKKLYELNIHPLDIHRSVEDVTELTDAVFMKEIDDHVFIYKSHIHNNRKMEPDAIIHIYRHPLDVFLSARNYLFHQSKAMKQERLDQLFIDGAPKSVEEIVAHNELDYYFNEFNESVGQPYWPGMLGEYSNYFNYVNKAIDCEKTISIRYEDLFDSLELEAKKAFEFSLGVKIRNIHLDKQKINRQTKGSNNKKFFWKAKQGNYKDFLSKEQIETFMARHIEDLTRLGYGE